jgi:hypothetical protein
LRGSQPLAPVAPGLPRASEEGGKDPGLRPRISLRLPEGSFPARAPGKAHQKALHLRSSLHRGGHRRVPDARRRLAGNRSAMGANPRSPRASSSAPGRMPDAASACAGAVPLSGHDGEGVGARISACSNEYIDEHERQGMGFLSPRAQGFAASSSGLDSVVQARCGRAARNGRIPHTLQTLRRPAT